MIFEDSISFAREIITFMYLAQDTTPTLPLTTTKTGIIGSMILANIFWAQAILGASVLYLGRFLLTVVLRTSIYLAPPPIVLPLDGSTFSERPIFDSGRHPSLVMYTDVFNDVETDFQDLVCVYKDGHGSRDHHHGS